MSTPLSQRRTLVQADSVPTVSAASPPMRRRIVSTARNQGIALNSTYTCSIHTWSDDNGGKEFPLYMAMADLIVTPTGFPENQEKEALCRKIEMMSGEVQMAYTSKTTHILAAHANTNKVHVGRKNNIPIVTAAWIESLWEACQQNNPYVHASLPDYRHHQYECKLFYNLIFCFSPRYEDATENFYGNIIKTHGGTVSNGLKSPPTYFYVCEGPEDSKTYEAAKRRKIPCVRLSWIMESVRSRTVLCNHPDYSAGNRRSSVGVGLGMPNPPTPHGFGNRTVPVVSAGNWFEPGVLVPYRLRNGSFDMVSMSVSHASPISRPRTAAPTPSRNLGLTVTISAQSDNESDSDTSTLDGDNTAIYYSDLDTTMEGVKDSAKNNENNNSEDNNDGDGDTSAAA